MTNEWSNSTVMASGSELVTINDPVQAAADRAADWTDKSIENLYMLTETTGIKAKLEELGIKINPEQATKFFAAFGVYQAFKATKAYRKNILIGISAYLAYQNQEKLLGKKLI